MLDAAVPHREALCLFAAFLALAGSAHGPMLLGQTALTVAIVEGALLIAAYVIIALAAFFYPNTNQSSTLAGSEPN